MGVGNRNADCSTQNSRLENIRSKFQPVFFHFVLLSFSPSFSLSFFLFFPFLFFNFTSAVPHGYQLDHRFRGQSAWQERQIRSF